MDNKKNDDYPQFDVTANLPQEDPAAPSSRPIAWQPCGRAQKGPTLRLLNALLDLEDLGVAQQSVIDWLPLGGRVARKVREERLALKAAEDARFREEARHGDIMERIRTVEMMELLAEERK